MPEDARITAAAEASTVLPGDVVHLVVTLEHGPDVDMTLHVPDDTLGGLPVAERTRDAPRRIGDRVRDVYRIKLRATAIGSYVLPPLSATTHAKNGGADGAMQSEAVYIDVRGEPPASDGNGLKDIKPLQPVHYRTIWPYVAAGATLAFGVVAYFLWRWRRRRPPAPPRRLLPHEAALAALADLRQRDMGTLQAVRQVYFAISEVLRAYVEARFSLNATDLTTEEILARLPRLTELSGVEGARLREFLSETDRVKYAHHVPSLQEVEQNMARARAFVEGTQSQAVTASAPEATVGVR